VGPDTLPAQLEGGVRVDKGGLVGTVLAGTNFGDNRAFTRPVAKRALYGLYN
jgi:hypothetical protein